MPGRKRLQQSGTDGGINPESLAVRSDAGRVRNVIQKLTPPDRMVLVLRDMEGFSDEEVAAITGLRSGTVRVRLHRARLLVRKELMKAVKPRSGKAAHPRFLGETRPILSWRAPAVSGRGRVRARRFGPNPPAAKPRSPNSQTISTASWTIRFARN